MKKIFTMVGMGIGALAVILGLVVLNMDTGSSYLESASFGADFYTYIYRASRYAAENIWCLSEIVSKGLGFLLIVIGGTDICVFGSRLETGNQASKEEESAQPVSAEPVKMAAEPAEAAPAAAAQPVAAPVEAPAQEAPEAPAESSAEAPAEKAAEVPEA